jgi:hypothetical protein
MIVANNQIPPASTGMSKTTNIGTDISSQRLENPSSVRLSPRGAKGESGGEAIVAGPGERIVSGRLGAGLAALIG